MGRLTAIASAALFLAACATEPPRSNDHPVSAAAPHARVARMPFVQAANRQPEAKPIGAGPLVEAAIEPYMDRQERALRTALRGNGVTIGRLGDVLVLNVRSDALFGANSVALSVQGRGILARVAFVAQRFDSTQLTVNGYTDTTGTTEHNLQISQKRVAAVSNALADRGIDPRRISAKGYGEVNLRIPTGSNVDEPRNRRLEIRITPLSKA